MGALDRLNVGLVGAAGRGGSYRESFEANGARIHAVCDTRADKLDECARVLGAKEKYTDYAEMIEKSEIDAVAIGTPMPLHVPQAVTALKKNIHVLSEVPAGVSIEECRDLVLACKNSRAVYMMAENYTYIRSNFLVKELVRRGLFGEVYYAEGEYLHELKGLGEVTPWRRRWQTGIDGVTYGTHSLGPILQWMPGDRVVRVSCEGSGRHYRDPRGESYHQESAVMLCKTARDALIKIRVDMVSDRPHAMANYQLQGTDGVYESSRDGLADRAKIWLRSLSAGAKWFDLESLMELDDFAQKHLPEIWRNPPEEALRAGHWGGDYFEVRDFVRAVRGDSLAPIGIHEAMDMTLPGLVSQRSILEGGSWLAVPDSRAWLQEQPLLQLHMRLSEKAFHSPLEPKVPEGYRLRQFADADASGYLTLMAKAGFQGWDEKRLAQTTRSVLPGGFFVIEHCSTGNIVATATAQHNPRDFHPQGAEMGWVAGDPEHKGKGLGLAVCSAATARLVRIGYNHIYLLTDDFRLPAIKTYLKIGYAPFIAAEGMVERWKKIFAILSAECPAGGFAGPRR